MTDNGITMESRPLIITRDTTAGLAAPYVAAPMGHEFTHFLQDNTLDDGSDEGVATMLAGYELEAWDVTRTILEASGAQEGEMWKDAQYVDWLRKQTVSPDAPFTPTPLTTWALQQVGLMHKNRTKL